MEQQSTPTPSRKAREGETEGFHRVTDDTSVRRLTLADAPAALAVTHASFSVETAPDEVIRHALANSADAFWGIFRRSDDAREPTLIGYYAFLLLNESGHDRLLERRFDAKQPVAETLASTPTETRAVYVWSVVARNGLTAIAGPTITTLMAERYAGLPVYATIATNGGMNVARRTGYRPVSPGDDRLGGLFVLDRHVADREALARRQHDRARRLASRIRVVVVSNGEQLAQALAIRASVFMAEQQCPYEEEFDANDYTCTHFLGYIDDKPAATMRLRYFADWVKFERIAVLPKYRRQTLVAGEIVRAVVEFSRRKGYRAGYGTAQKRYARFWKHFGFEVMPARDTPIVFSDHEYIEILGRFEPHPNPITISGDPFVIMRPEGRWDEPGVLEQSRDRPATNPH
jgi:predicted GNAT family N-acyltransferase